MLLDKKTFNIVELAILKIFFFFFLKNLSKNFSNLNCKTDYCGFTNQQYLE